MLKKNLKLLSLCWLVLNLNGCATIPDVPLCAEISISRGVCTYTVSNRTVIVDDENPLEGATWFDMRAKVMSVPASSWAKIKAWMIKVCKQQGNCSVEISQWDRDIAK